MALASISGVSNIELWNLARKVSPSFKSHTSEGTADMFSEKGFEALKVSDIGALNEFFDISLRVAFQKMTVSRARNLFEDKGLVEVYDTPNGGYVQRMAVDSIKPVTPAFKNLENGDSVDPFIVRKPKATERFFEQNFDYQSFITLQDFQVKTIFISEFGMGEFIAGVMAGLENGYTIQKSLNTKEALNSAINSTEYPLQDTQVINVAWDFTTNPTDAMLTGYLLGIKDVITAMTTTEQTSGYNAGKFATVVDTGELVMVARAGIKNRIELGLEVGAFNLEKLSIPVSNIIEVDNFGGLQPTDGEGAVLYPVYDKNGEMIGYNTVEDATEVTVSTESAVMVDPNADVLAVICQRGLLFENRQNPYEVRPIYNPRGLYQNYWASSPNNSIVVDPYYTMVVVRGVTE